MKTLAIFLIEWYQKKGGGSHFFQVDCNYTPTCSQYTKEAIHKYGFFKGITLGWSRIKRCNNSNLIEPIEDSLK